MSHFYSAMCLLIKWNNKNNSWINGQRGVASISSKWDEFHLLSFTYLVSSLAALQWEVYFSLFLVASYFWSWTFVPVMWNWTSSTMKTWRAPPMWWELSEGVSNQVRLETKSESAIRYHLFSACNCVLFVPTDRYVIYGNHRDSWVHGAIDPSSGTSVMLELTRVLGRMVKQGEESHSWMNECLIVLFVVSDKEFVSAPLCGRQVEASQVHYLWKLGSGGVRPYWVCRIHRGDLQLIHKIRHNTKQYVDVCSERRNKSFITN